MDETILMIVAALLGVGLVGVVAVSRRRPADARALWKKYLAYAVIVLGVIFSIMLRPHDVWPALAVAIVAGGLMEILRLHAPRSQRRLGVLLAALAAYGAIATGFLLFAFTVEPALQLKVYVIVAVFDGFSQLFGQWIGRRRLAPRISPGKTLEGSLGGLCMAAAVAGVLAWSSRESIPISLAGGAILAIAALMGDLGASLHKRTQGAKDYGTILPSQGGVLDRFDSFLAAGAVAVLLARAFPNSQNVGPTLLLAGVFVAILAVAEILHRTTRLSVELTRKFSHAASAGVALTLPAFGVTGPQVLMLCVVFTVLLIAARRWGMLESIHGIDRGGSLGGYCFPAALGACYAAYLLHGVRLWLALPILILAICDPLAALVGRRWPVGAYRIFGDRKSLAGSGAFFIGAIAVSAVTLWVFGLGDDLAQAAPLVLLVAAVATVLEAVSVRGLDNLTVPLGVLSVLALARSAGM